MRSSGSTPSRSRSGALRLLLLVAGEDHPRACTGRRLIARGLAELVRPTRRPSPGPALLDPRAEIPLSQADGASVRRTGLLGVDCSWNRLQTRGGYPTRAPWLERLPVRRRLPFLLAGNPQHYGRLAELNTAEAFAAALFVLGEEKRARELIGGFGGGPAFLELNREPLRSYSDAPDAEAVRVSESEYF